VQGKSGEVWPHPGTILEEALHSVGCLSNRFELHLTLRLLREETLTTGRYFGAIDFQFLGADNFCVVGIIPALLSSFHLSKAASISASSCWRARRWSSALACCLATSALILSGFSRSATIASHTCASAMSARSVPRKRKAGSTTFRMEPQ